MEHLSRCSSSKLKFQCIYISMLLFEPVLFTFSSSFNQTLLLGVYIRWLETLFPLYIIEITGHCAKSRTFSVADILKPLVLRFLGHWNLEDISLHFYLSGKTVIFMSINLTIMCLINSNVNLGVSLCGLNKYCDFGWWKCIQDDIVFELLAICIQTVVFTSCIKNVHVCVPI